MFGDLQGLLILDKTFFSSTITHSFQQIESDSEPHFNIRVRYGKTLSFQLKILNQNTAECIISKNFKLPAYGVVTLIKAALQELLFSRNILLLHGGVDAIGNIYLIGDNLQLWQTSYPHVPIEQRAITLQKKEDTYVVYNCNNNICIKLNKIFIHSKKAITCKLALDQMIKSNWLYFFFHHYFSERKLIVPLAIEKRVILSSVDLLKASKYTIGVFDNL